MKMKYATLRLDAARIAADRLDDQAVAKGYRLCIEELMQPTIAALEDIAEMPEHDQDDAHRLRAKARAELNRLLEL